MNQISLRRLTRAALIALTGGILAAGILPGHQPSTAVAAKSPTPAKAKAQSLLREHLNKMPLYFIENQGQTDKRVAFYVQGRDKTLYFTPRGITFALDNPAAGQQPGRWTLKLEFLGANPKVKIVGHEKTDATFNYFIGAPDQWKNSKTYQSIRYENLWPGIDLVYSGTVNQMKYEFLVQPGADPNQIRLAYRGASSLGLNDKGSLEVKTPVTGFTDDKPVSFQEADGIQREVPTTYVVNTKAQEYRFRVSNYDRSKPLVIDPVMVVYCGYIGGSGSDLGTSVAVDDSGFAYVTGFTNSVSNSTVPGYNQFPVKVGPDLSYNSVACPNCYDAFVAKIRPDGSGLVYCGYIGGEHDDKGYGITVDSLGRAYVVGKTISVNKFPVKIGPKLTISGVQDGFIARVSANGASLDYCGYLGGSGDDGARSVAVDKQYAAYVVGSSDSKDLLGLMSVPSSWNWGFAGGLADLYALKIRPDGVTTIFGGFIGGSEWDSATGIDLDAENNVYVSGFTQSDEKSFPVKIGPDKTFNGSQDGFVARINQSGLWLDFCGFIGGKGDDTAADIAVTSDGTVFVAGDTTSDESTFPVVVGPDLTFNGSIDAFVARLKKDATGLLFCGYLGGAKQDSATGIALDAAGGAYLTGVTNSDQSSFPVKQGPDLSHNGGNDAFVAKVTAFSNLVYCGYVGGKGDDYAWGIAVQKSQTNSDAFIVGRTDSTEAMAFPLVVGPDLTYNGSGPPLGWDAFVTRVSKPDLK